MPEFIPALELAERYYNELVGPLLRHHYPRLQYAAALIGYGSEVLGFDTPMSMDHAWAPRMHIFLAEADLGLAGELDALLRRTLPVRFMGFPLGVRPSDDEPGIFFMDEQASPGDVRHRVIFSSLRQFIGEVLGWDMQAAPEPADWLIFPQQVLRTLTAGRVFCDDRAELGNLRRALAFYPDDIWRYLLAAGWDRIGQEQPLMQRAGDAGDALGAAIMSARLSHDVMQLCFLLERTYAPYPKWFGSGFQRLECAGRFMPVLLQAQVGDWRERAEALGRATEMLAALQNGLDLTGGPLPEKLVSFHQRPYRVIPAEEIATALLESIQDVQVRRIAAKGPLGGLDQFSDNTILRSRPLWREALKKLYD